MAGYSKAYGVSIFRKALVIIFEQLYCGYLCVTRSVPFFIDVIKTWFKRKKDVLPYSVADLLDPEVYSNLVLSNHKAGDNLVVQSVEYSDGLKLHAKSSDRAWLTMTVSPSNSVVAHGEGNEALDSKAKKSRKLFVFAKLHAKNVFVRSLFSMFDVYRNELDTYLSLKETLPVVTPTVYFVKWTPSRFLILMEDLRLSNNGAPSEMDATTGSTGPTSADSSKTVIFPNIWEYEVTKPLAKKILETLAKLHAAYYDQDVPDSCWTDQNRPYKPKFMGLLTFSRVYRRNKQALQAEGARLDLLPDDIADVYEQALWRWDELRAFWSRSKPKVMCHGDTHFGNFYIQLQSKSSDGQPLGVEDILESHETNEDSGSSKSTIKRFKNCEYVDIGTFDFQAKAAEHPMRDVTYFLCSSYSKDDLPNDEVELIKYYLEQLKLNLEKRSKEGNASRSPDTLERAEVEVPSFDDCWLQYRLQSFYALYAFVFSAGIPSLMDNHQLKAAMPRVIDQFRRVDATGALYDLFDGKL